MFDEIFQIISNNKKIELDPSLEPSVYTSQMLSQLSSNKFNPHIEEWSDKIEEKIEIQTENYSSKFENISLFELGHLSYYSLQEILSNKRSFNLSVEYIKGINFVNYQKLQYLHNKTDEFDLNCTISFPYLSKNLEKYDINNTVLSVNEHGYIFSIINESEGVHVTSYKEGKLKNEIIDKYIDISKKGEFETGKTNYVSIVKNTIYSLLTFTQNKRYLLLQNDKYEIFIFELINDGIFFNLKPFKKITEKIFNFQFFEVNFFIYFENENIFLFTSYSKGIILYNLITDKVILHSENFKNKDGLYINYYTKKIFYDNHVLFILNKGFGFTAFNISQILKNETMELSLIYELSHPYLEDFDFEFISKNLKYLNLIVNNWESHEKKIPEFYIQLLINNYQDTSNNPFISFNKIFVSPNNYSFKQIVNQKDISFLYESSGKSLFIIKNSNDQFPNIFKIDLSKHLEFFEKGDVSNINLLIDHDAFMKSKSLNDCLVIAISFQRKILLFKDLAIIPTKMMCKFKTPASFTLKFKGISNKCNTSSETSYFVCEKKIEIIIKAYSLKDIALKIMCYFLIALIAPSIFFRLYIVKRFYNIVKLYCLHQIIKLRRKFRSGYSDATNSLELGTCKQEINFISESTDHLDKIKETDTEVTNNYN